MKYICDIQEAIKETIKPYRKWHDWYTDNESMQERVFCYEFYHQFRKLMEIPKNNVIYQNLYLHGEMTKYGKAPDFVLHGGQDNTNIQVIAIEVKTRVRIEQNQSECNMKKDLEKLLNLLSDTHLKYEKGVFIGINCNNDYLKTKIQKMGNSTLGNDLDLLNKIYIIGTDDNEPTPLNKILE